MNTYLVPIQMSTSLGPSCERVACLPCLHFLGSDSHSAIHSTHVDSYAIRERESANLHVCDSWIWWRARKDHRSPDHRPNSLAKNVYLVRGWSEALSLPRLRQGAERI